MLIAVISTFLSFRTLALKLSPAAEASGKGLSDGAIRVRVWNLFSMKRFLLAVEMTLIVSYAVNIVLKMFLISHISHLNLIRFQVIQILTITFFQKENGNKRQ